jgi:hypothetical protein
MIESDGKRCLKAPLNVVVADKRTLTTQRAYQMNDGSSRLLRTEIRTISLMDGTGVVILCRPLSRTGITSREGAWRRSIAVIMIGQEERTSTARKATPSRGG